ncbi:MAG TPA: hypothetical protein VGW98_08815 [Solirubrobacteraceae bacterium]|jgi:hypothetical protein|nr:hypothetical protein [Solirubrobacteraceae bacterium]
MTRHQRQQDAVIGDGRALAELAIEGHGGMTAWLRAQEIAVQISSGGFAFASKLQGHAVRAVLARVATSGQRVVFEGYPSGGQRGVLETDGSVRIQTAAGTVTAARENPRAAFGDLRHGLWWDRVDILYFGTYAIWTYLSTPFVLLGEGYELRELAPWDERGERWRRLGVRFPDGVHTHSREQVFYIDAAGLIRRHDYTAEPFGGWAKAAHYCFDHRSFDGLLLPTRRLVYPRRSDNRPRSHPRLVWIEVSEPSA